jgi:hypothetical protein
VRAVGLPLSLQLKWEGKKGGAGGAGGAALGGAEAFDSNLTFFDLFWLVFFESSKKGLDSLGPDSSDARTSKINTNIHCFPFTTGQREGSVECERRLSDLLL